MPQIILHEQKYLSRIDPYDLNFEVSDEFVESLKHQLLHQLLTDAFQCGTHRYWHFTPTGRLSLDRGRNGSPDIRDYINHSTEINAVVDQYLKEHPERALTEIAKHENGFVKPILINISWQLVDMYVNEQWSKLRDILTSGEYNHEKETVIREEMRKAQQIVDRCQKQLIEMDVD